MALVQTNRILGEAGQTFIEAVIILPAFLLFITLFFNFIYQQFWIQVIEYSLHETAICEASLNNSDCIRKINFNINNKSLFMKANIYKSKNKLNAEIYFMGIYRWQTLTLTTSNRKYLMKQEK